MLRCAAWHRVVFHRSAPLRRALALALLASAATVLLRHAAEGRWKLLGALLDITFAAHCGYGALSALVAMLTMLRVVHALVRHRESARLLCRMSGHWLGAASAAVAFCKYSKSPEEFVNRFLQIFVRLVSLLGAVAMAELAVVGSGGGSAAELLLAHELLDVQGIDRTSLVHLRSSACKLEVVFQWVQNVVLDNVSTGVLGMPAPALSRVFQELGSGIVAYRDAMRCQARQPQLLPFAAVADLLLLVHTAATPVALARAASHPAWSALAAFALAFAIWSGHLLAGELEDFASGRGPCEAQRALNASLLSLLSGTSRCSPGLSVEPSQALRRLRCQARGPRGVSVRVALGELLAPAAVKQKPCDGGAFDGISAFGPGRAFDAPPDLPPSGSSATFSPLDQDFLAISPAIPSDPGTIPSAPSDLSCNGNHCWSSGDAPVGGTAVVAEGEVKDDASVRWVPLPRQAEAQFAVVQGWSGDEAEDIDETPGLCRSMPVVAPSPTKSPLVFSIGCAGDDPGDPWGLVTPSSREGMDEVLLASAHKMAMSGSSRQYAVGSGALSDEIPPWGATGGDSTSSDVSLGEGTSETVSL